MNAQLNDARLPARFWQKVKVSDRGCWIWIAAKNRSGYGIFGVKGSRTALAHRHAFVALCGPLEKGLVMDHLCRTPSCINPAHLEQVTPKANSQRGETGKATGRWQRSKTHCTKGHPYTGANLYVPPNGERWCRTCQRDNKRRWRAAGGKT